MIVGALIGAFMWLALSVLATFTGDTTPWSGDDWMFLMFSAVSGALAGLFL